MKNLNFYQRNDVLIYGGGYNGRFISIDGKVDFITEMVRFCEENGFDHSVYFNVTKTGNDMVLVFCDDWREDTVYLVAMMSDHMWSKIGWDKKRLEIEPVGDDKYSVCKEVCDYVGGVYWGE